MNVSFYRRVSIALMMALLASCAAERNPLSLFDPREQGLPVIDALALVDRPLPDVFVRQTLAPDDAYSRENAAISGATVIIRQGSAVYDYTEDPNIKGRYLPPPGAPLVQPETEYHLLVQYGDREVSGHTRTPPRFRIDASVMIQNRTLELVRNLKTYRDGPNLVFTAPENQIPYQENLLEARFAPLPVKGYQVGVLNLETDSDYVIKGDFLTDEDFEDLKREVSSPPLEAQDGRLRLPWFAIYFAGRHIIKIYALDDNWFDYTRSSPEQPSGAFGNLAGDNFERPLFRLEGGIGLFGSASVDSLGFVILPGN